MVKCPVCGKPGVSYLRKIILEPNQITECRECGATLSNTWVGLLIPFSFLVTALIVIMSIEVLQWIKIVSVIAAIIIYFFLDLKFSPLVKKEKKK